MEERKAQSKREDCSTGEESPILPERIQMNRVQSRERKMSAVQKKDECHPYTENRHERGKIALDKHNVKERRTHSNYREER